MDQKAVGNRQKPAMLVVARTGQPLASRVITARTWSARVKGLLGRPALPAGEAMWFPGCRSIHTCGMRFAIDAVFVDRQWRVVAVRERLAPWRLVLPVWGAWGVVELAEGTLARGGFGVGDELQLA